MNNTVAAWLLLQRLSQIEAAVIFNAQTLRYHFLLHCQAMDQVNEETLKLLEAEGYVQRERSAITVYTISSRGRQALSHRQSGLTEPLGVDVGSLEHA